MQAIARQLTLGRNTVWRWLRAGQAPEHRRAARRSALDRHAEYLKRRWAEGCRKASHLYREIQQQGYRGCEARVRQWVARHLKADLPATQQHGAKRSTAVVERFPVPSARTSAWLLLRDSAELSEDERRYTELLTESSPEIQRAQHLARQFRDMVKHRRRESLEQWLEAAECTELRGFAGGIRRDQEAVEAALSLRPANLPSRPRRPSHQRLQPVRYLPDCSDCYRAERTSSRVGLAPTVDQRLFTAHATVGLTPDFEVDSSMVASAHLAHYDCLHANQ